ncbi:Hypothetical predicted protein [Olea europaea subsp. europaea]|uniref:Uncharacterized protein n=1 Tax=Olea europaea subsp. europaea TaxID=158383 RepID=A0A8S0PQD7_OLEEU|nr:Hypothetical predicted protein [Olea europaea subsp. europaea]
MTLQYRGGGMLRQISSRNRYITSEKLREGRSGLLGGTTTPSPSPDASKPLTVNVSIQSHADQDAPIRNATSDCAAVTTTPPPPHPML